ncbi:MAG: ribosome maturation factor RimP [Elusimicrobiota bacterium]
MNDLKAVESAVEGLLNQEAAELVDLRWLREGGRWVLRFYVDKHGGVSLDDCEYLSKRIGALLDAMDSVPYSYSLEVSSPGLDRVLKKEKDFLRFCGHRAKLRLRAPLEGQRRFNGLVKGFEAGEVLFDTGQKTLRVVLVEVEEARLDPEVEI